MEKYKAQEESVIKVNNLVRNYYKIDNEGKIKSDAIKVLKGINFEIKEREFVGIIGRSGCDKTTLLKILV